MYAGLFVNDALVMSETLATLAVALAILLAYRVGRSPTWGNAAWLGAACGLAMLARAELGLLLPCMVLPVALFVRAFTVWRRLLLVLVACAAAGLVVSPWLVANLTRFDEPVLFSTNDGLTICGANLHRTYYGSGTGLWALDCAGFPVPKGDRSVVSNALRKDGLHFVRTHLGRVPVVVAVRIGRVWSLYAPGQMADYNRNEGRPVWASWLAFASFWVLVPFAVAGGVLLRRRRVPITPARRPVRDRHPHRGGDLRAGALPGARRGEPRGARGGRRRRVCSRRDRVRATSGADAPGEDGLPSTIVR